MYYWQFLLSLVFYIFPQSTSVEFCGFEPPANRMDCQLEIEHEGQDGFVIRSFPNTKDKLSEGHFKNGSVDGYWRFFYENGEVHWEGNYDEGEPNGFFRTFFESGRVREAGQLKNCLRDGYWNFYFDNKKNQVQFNGYFDNGIPSGTWQEFDRAGKVVNRFVCS